jgi:ABC-type branched-subunit amino acid transport system ATPase component
MKGESPILEVRELGKSFGGLRVISDLSFSVPTGRRLALIGPNGAGKTTVFNLISGVYAPDGGAIFLDGREITNIPSRHRIRYGLSRSFQNIRLMSHLTALENVMLGQHHRARTLTGLLHPIGLVRRNSWSREGRDALKTAGLDIYADELIANLPYGVQKRIELVRALLANPYLLMLDEPAAGLNPAEREELQRMLENVSERGITMMVVEHDMKFIGDLCEHVVVLNFGRKIAEGSPAEISANPEVRKAYLGDENTEGHEDAA